MCDSNQKEMQEAIIKNYEHQEQMMILLFCQWCVNHDLDPYVLYQKAYPQQQIPSVLTKMIEETVPEKESVAIDTSLLLDVFSQFGNEDLAFLISAHEQWLKTEKNKK